VKAWAIGMVRQPGWFASRQRDDRPNTFMHTRSAQRLPGGLKGRAWITADSFQIVRIEAEWSNLVPQIQLLASIKSFEYGPIPFQKKTPYSACPRAWKLFVFANIDSIGAQVSPTTCIFGRYR